MAINPEISAKASQALGLPPGFKVYSPFPFKGMNWQDAPHAIDDHEFYWIENFVRLGNGNLRTLGDKGSPVYTSPTGKTIVYFEFYTLGTSYYCAIFLSDGSAIQLNMATLVQTTIGPAGTFYNATTGYKPFAKQWGSIYLLISNRNTSNDYWAWDGTLLYGAGTAAPKGVNLASAGFAYSSVPTITTFGGAGSGMTFNTVVNNGAIAEINITNPGSGYSPGDIVQLAFSGGGSDNSAILKANLSSGKVGGVSVTAGGSGYTSATVTFSAPPSGAGATATGTVNVDIDPASGTGPVTSVTITNAGSGYTSAPTITITGDGSSATATAVIASGAVVGVNIVSSTSDFTSASITFTAPPPGTTATGTAVISTGSVTSYNTLVGGSGYVTAPTVSFSGGGGGAGAAATATVSAGAVTGLVITNGGTGYTVAPTIAFSGPGSGASATAVITGNGQIASVTITNAGSGYVSAPSVTITGTGAGALAKASLVPAAVASITVVNGGTGFTSVPLIKIVGGGGSGATALAVLTGTSVAAVNLTGSGTGYTSAPSITFKGGGSGATLPTATVNMNGTRVGSITLTSGGSGITDSIEVSFSGGGGSGAGAVVVLAPTSIASVVLSSTGQFYTDIPAVEVSAGANNSAYATVSLMPYGISGSAMETFLSRVWIINPAIQPYSTIPPGNLWFYSAPGSIWDFATSDGGGSSINTDSFLQTQYVGIRQSSGYLYFFGNGSVSVLSNVNTSGSPATTTFNYQNVDPQAGLDFRDSIQDFGKSIITSNNLGIFGLYGGSLANISKKIEQLFEIAAHPDVGGIEPSSAIMTIYDVKHYINYLTLVDPDTKVARNVMLLWNEKDWTVASQSGNLTFIGTQKVASKYQAWGTNGIGLYPLFTTPSSSLIKRVETKFYGAQTMFLQKQALAAYVQATDNSNTNAGVSGAISLSISGLAQQNNFNPMLQSGNYVTALQQPNFQSPNPFYGFWGTSLEGIGFVLLGARFTTTSPDFTLGNLVIGYADVVASY
jgi:hypothetical protein